MHAAAGSTEQQFNFLQSKKNKSLSWTNGKMKDRWSFFFFNSFNLGWHTDSSIGAGSAAHSAQTSARRKLEHVRKDKMIKKNGVARTTINKRSDNKQFRLDAR